MVVDQGERKGKCFHRQTVELLFVLIKKGYWQAPVGFLKEIILILIKEQREEGLHSPEPFVGFGREAAPILLSEVFSF